MTLQQHTACPQPQAMQKNGLLRGITDTDCCAGSSCAAEVVRVACHGLPHTGNQSRGRAPPGHSSAVVIHTNHGALTSATKLCPVRTISQATLSSGHQQCWCCPRTYAGCIKHTTCCSPSSSPKISAGHSAREPLVSARAGESGSEAVAVGSAVPGAISARYSASQPDARVVKDPSPPGAADPAGSVAPASSCDVAPAVRLVDASGLMGARRGALNLPAGFVSSGDLEEDMQQLSDLESQVCALPQ